MYWCYNYSQISCIRCSNAVFPAFYTQIHFLTLQITMLKVEQGFGGERKAQRQGYFVDISIIRIGNLIVDVGVQDLHSW